MATQGTTGGGNATTIQTPQPQTTLQAPGGPFRRYTFASNAPMYTVSAQAFGATITQPLVAASAYARGFRCNFAVTGGTGGATGAFALSATAGYGTADSPFNVVAQVVLQDAEGNNLISLPGYEALFLLPLINGAFGAQKYADVTALPSWSALSTASSIANNGNFSFESYLPLEYLAGGIGVLGMNAASQLPQITWTLGSSASVYSTGWARPISSVILACWRSFHENRLAPRRRYAVSSTQNGVEPPRCDARNSPFRNTSAW